MADTVIGTRSELTQMRNAQVARALAEEKRGVLITTRGAMPLSDDEASEWLVWTINDAHVHHPYADAVFDLHKRSLIHDETIAWANDGGGKLYTREPHDGIESVVYPLDVVSNYYGGLRYFTCSIAFVMALAILTVEMQHLDLRLHGVYCMPNIEYREQRACLEFWCGVAIGRGVYPKLSSGTLLLRSDYLYAYEDKPVRHVGTVDVMA